MSGASDDSTPVVNHWSGNGVGEAFTLEISYDASKYQKAAVTINLRRNATTGLTESMESTWSWSPRNKYGDGKEKVTAAVRACGFFTPALIGAAAVSLKSQPLSNFFTPPPRTSQTAKAAATSSSEAATSSAAPATAASPSACSAAAMAAAAAEAEVAAAEAAAPATAASPSACSAAEVAASLAAAAALAAEELVERPRAPLKQMRDVLREAGLGDESLAQIRDCPGHLLAQLPEGPAAVHYPWGIHAAPIKALAWTLPNDSGAVFARATEAPRRAPCMRYVVVDDMAVDPPEPCPPCQLLGTLVRLGDLQSRAGNETLPPQLNNHRLTFAQMGAKLKKQKAESSLERLKQWHLGYRLRIAHSCE